MATKKKIADFDISSKKKIILVSKETGLPVQIADDPLSCVAVGTGKALEQEELFSTMLSEY